MKKGPIIARHEVDIEGRLIQTEGPLCVIYEGGLLRDEQALIAMSSEYNLNANVGMPESEATGFGKVCQLFIRP